MSEERDFKMDNNFFLSRKKKNYMTITIFRFWPDFVYCVTRITIK